MRILLLFSCWALRLRNTQQQHERIIQASVPHFETVFQKLTNSITALQNRIEFLTKHANTTLTQSLHLETDAQTTGVRRAEENINIITLVSEAEDKIEPEVKSFQDTLEKMNTTLAEIEKNVEGTKRLENLQKVYLDSHGIFVLLKPVLKKLKKRVDRMEDHLSGNFTELIRRAVNKEATVILQDQLHNASLVVKNFGQEKSNKTVDEEQVQTEISTKAPS